MWTSNPLEVSETMRLNYGCIMSSLEVLALHGRATPSCFTHLEDTWNISGSSPVNQNAFVPAKVYFKRQHSAQHSLCYFKLFTLSTSWSSWAPGHGIHTGIHFGEVHPCSTSRGVQSSEIWSNCLGCRTALSRPLKGQRLVTLKS